MSQEGVEKLTALLVKQAEMAAAAQEQASQREQRLAGMVERLLQDRPSESPREVATTGNVPSHVSVSKPLVNAPHLNSSVSLREFDAWRQKFEGYALLARVSSLPPAEQRAALLAVVSDDWTRIIRYNLSVSSEASLSDVIKAMEEYLRGQRNVIVDRRDFYRRNQEPSETFDDILRKKVIELSLDFVAPAVRYGASGSHSTWAGIGRQLDAHGFTCHRSQCI